MAENAEAWPLIVVMRLSEIKDPEFLSCRLQNGSTGVTSTSQTSCSTSHVHIALSQYSLPAACIAWLLCTNKLSTHACVFWTPGILPSQDVL